MTLGNGALAQHDYDAARRLTALRNLKSDASVISVFTYSYDAIGNRLGVQEANGDVVTWSYDEAYQLTREQRCGANAYDATFTYDGLGNRLNKIEGGATTTYAYDAANELLTTEDASGLTTFTYDANGNTIGEVRPNADRVTYTWDVENHLTKVELPSAVVNTITLDGDGKRRRMEDSAGLRKIIWDMENILLETDNNDATAAAYTLAPEGYGALISQRRSGFSSFHHFDALGSTDRLTDGSANTLAAYLYRSFGQQSVLAGSSANPFTWVGQLGYYRQPDPADYWVEERIENPQLGRWISREPEEQRHNRYTYAVNNPLRFIDPSGLSCVELGCTPISFWQVIRKERRTRKSPWELFQLVAVDFIGTAWFKRQLRTTTTIWWQRKLLCVYRCEARCQIWFEARVRFETTYKTKTWVIEDYAECAPAKCHWDERPKDGKPPLCHCIADVPGKCWADWRFRPSLFSPHCTGVFRAPGFEGASVGERWCKYP